MQEDAKVVWRFRDILTSILREMLLAYPAIIPQSEEDKQIFKIGMERTQQFLYELEHAETVRDIGRLVDIQALLNDFDIDSIEDFQKNLLQMARTSMTKLTETLESMM